MSNKRKRNVLTMEQKIEIIAKLDEGETCVALALHYNIGKATVSDIKNNRNAIMDFVSKMDSGDGMKRRKVMKLAKNQDLDKAMEMWFTQKRSLNEPISGSLICEKALEMNSKLGGPEDFKASSGWLHKFKSRHGIRELQVQGEILSATSSDAEISKETLCLFVKKEEYSQDAVYNAYESALNWKALPKKSLASCQEHAAHGFKDFKEKVTIMTCANAAGTHKLPLLLIGKSKKPHCFKNIKSGNEENDKKGPSPAEAFAAFETGLEWFEKQSECCPSQLLLLKRLRDLAAEKHVAACH